MGLVWLVVSFAACFSAVFAGDHVVSLTDDTFADTIKESKTVWLVEFYAPWCSSCITLQPLLEEAAIQSKGVMNIGKVNVDENSKLASKYDIVRYPTLMYGRWNTRLNEVELKMYPGDRTVDSFVKYGKRMSGDVVSEITSEKEWDQYISVDGSMLFFGKSMHTSENEELAKEFQESASRFHNNHIFSTSDDPTILSKFSREAPFIARIDLNQDKPYYYDPNDLSLSMWIDKNRHPSYTQVEASNFKQLGWYRIIVIGCYVPEKHNEFDKVMRTLASYTETPLSAPERDVFAFGWLNADRYVDYLSRFFVYPEQIPIFFVWNMSDQVYYNYEGPLEPKAIAQFLSNILAGKEHAYAQSNYPLKIYRYIARGYPWTLLWLLPIGLITIFLGFGCFAMWTHDTKAEKLALERSLAPKASSRTKKET